MVGQSNLSNMGEGVKSHYSKNSDWTRSNCSQNFIYWKRIELSIKSYSASYDSHHYRHDLLLISKIST
jgi:hypothetical protein